MKNGLITPIQSRYLSHLLNRRITAALAATALVLSVACGSGGDEARPTEQPSDSPTAPTSDATPASPTAIVRSGLPYGIDGPTRPPAIDIFEGIVEPEKIVFDTFDGGSVRLPDAPQATINRLFNAIRPVYVPVYGGASGGGWLSDSDIVLGYLGETEAYAYPVKFLNFHEIVNDEIDGVPVLISYCPLCASGVVYDRRIDGDTHVFGNTSALYQNDLVMIDHETGSYWFQTGGEAVVGPLSGTRLEPLASVMMPWSDWLELHPETLVLSRDQGFGTPESRYDRDPFGSYARSVDAERFPFPVDAELLNDRLRLSEIVLTVQIGEIEKAYPPGRIGDGAANDQIGGVPVVVFSRLSGPAAAAYSPVVGKDTLSFSSTADGQFIDSETGSNWNFSGQAVAGQLEGTQLTRLPTRRAMWFSISVDQPEMQVFLP